MSRLATPTLETERFILRPLERGDAAALFPTFADPEQMRYWSRGPFESEEELSDWFCDKDWNGRSWVVVAKSGGPALARLVASPEGDGVSQIGYLVVRDQQGQGIAGETLPALIGHLFAVEGNRRIWADTDPDNIRSNRLLEKLGFTMERRLKASWRTHIGVRDSFIWGLSASGWAAR